jgi:hypothetical protein
MARKKTSVVPNNSFTDILLYTAPNGKVKVEIFLHNENVWLTQDKIAQLFGVQRPAITKHLKNIFESGELNEDSVSSILEHTAADGKIYSTKFYNLDAIISVGYRVNSIQATHFRIWATERLKEYIIKGFTMDDERLKNPENIWYNFVGQIHEFDLHMHQYLKYDSMSSGKMPQTVPFEKQMLRLQKTI